MGDKTAIEWTDATAKRCTGPCQRDLPRSAFALDSSRPDGLTYWCRSCRNERSRRSYHPKPHQRRGFLVPTRDGDKLQARRRVNYLVEQGLIPHPDDCPCFDCGDGVFGEVYRHEYDHARGYDGENQLYVEPVCSKCHHNREDARHG